MSKMSLNYWMMVERYPNLKAKVGGSNPSCEISSLLAGNLPSDQLHLVLWHWHVSLMSYKILKKMRRAYGVTSRERKNLHMDLVHLAVE